MVKSRVLFLILTGVLLLLLEASLFCFVICPRSVDNFDVARAIVDWRSNPSPEREANLQMAIRHSRTKTVVFDGVIWVLIVLNMLAIIKVGAKGFKAIARPAKADAFSASNKREIAP